MKTISTLLTSLLIASASIIHSQTPTIFQPGPGLNDGSDQGGLNSGKDAWSYQDFPGNNYGADPQFIVTPVSNCNNTHANGYIQFDVSTLPLYVDSVKFVFTHLDHTSYCYSNCNADFYFACVTQSWDEMTVNYGNEPSHDTAFYGPINISFPNSFGEREYDITATYQLWRNGTIPNYGIVIYSTTVGCNNAAVMFAGSSSDDTTASKRPYLKIYASGAGINSPLANSLNLNVAPNPANDQTSVTFTLPDNSPAIFSMTDASGRSVMEDVIVSGQGQHTLQVSMSNLSSGLYIYSLRTAEGTVTGKLLH